MKYRLRLDLYCMDCGEFIRNCRCSYANNVSDPNVEVRGRPLLGDPS